MGILFLVGLGLLHPFSFSAQAVANTASYTLPVFQCVKVEGTGGFRGVRGADLLCVACILHQLECQHAFRQRPCFSSESFYRRLCSSLSNTRVSALKLASFANSYVPEEWVEK